MGIGRVGRIGRVARVGGKSLGPNDILTITDSGGVALITTAAPHGLVGAESIVVSGNSNATYNATHSVAAVPTTTTIQTDTSYDGDGTGGTWALV